MVIFTKLYYDADIHISYLHNGAIHSAIFMMQSFTSAICIMVIITKLYYDAVIHISYLHNGDIH